MRVKFVAESWQFNQGHKFVLRWCCFIVQGTDGNFVYKTLSNRHSLGNGEDHKDQILQEFFGKGPCPLAVH